MALSDYKELKYLKTGNAYIDTGIVPTNCVVEAQIFYVENPYNHKEHYLFGSGASDYFSMGYKYKNISDTSGEWYMALNRSECVVTNSYNDIFLNSTNDNPVTIEMSIKKVNFASATCYMIQNQERKKFNPSVSSIYINWPANTLKIGCNGDGINPGAFGVKSIKIYDNTDKTKTLIKDYIPVMTSTGETSFYDKIADEYIAPTQINNLPYGFLPPDEDVIESDKTESLIGTDYLHIPYIRSDNVHIDTGIIPTETTMIEICIQGKGLAANENWPNAIFGCANTVFQLTSYKHLWYYAYFNGEKTASDSEFLLGDNDTPIVIKFGEPGDSYNYFSINGTRIVSLPKDNKTITPTNTLKIFSRSDYPCGFNIYYCKIWETSTKTPVLLKDYIPVISKDGTKVSFYDRVVNEFIEPIIVDPNNTGTSITNSFKTDYTITPNYESITPDTFIQTFSIPFVIPVSPNANTEIKIKINISYKTAIGINHSITNNAFYLISNTNVSNTKYENKNIGSDEYLYRLPYDMIDTLVVDAPTETNFHTIDFNDAGGRVTLDGADWGEVNIADFINNGSAFIQFLQFDIKGLLFNIYDIEILDKSTGSLIAHYVPYRNSYDYSFFDKLSGLRTYPFNDGYNVNNGLLIGGHGFGNATSNNAITIKQYEDGVMPIEDYVASIINAQRENEGLQPMIMVPYVSNVARMMLSSAAPVEDSSTEARWWSQFGTNFNDNEEMPSYICRRLRSGVIYTEAFDYWRQEYLNDYYNYTAQGVSWGLVYTGDDTYLTARKALNIYTLLCCWDYTYYGHIGVGSRRDENGRLYILTLFVCPMYTSYCDCAGSYLTAPVDITCDGLTIEWKSGTDEPLPEFEQNIPIKSKKYDTSPFNSYLTSPHSMELYDTNNNLLPAVRDTTNDSVIIKTAPLKPVTLSNILGNYYAIAMPNQDITLGWYHYEAVEPYFICGIYGKFTPYQGAAERLDTYTKYLIAKPHVATIAVSNHDTGEPILNVPVVMKSTRPQFADYSVIKRNNIVLNGTDEYTISDDSKNISFINTEYPMELRQIGWKNTSWEYDITQSPDNYYLADSTPAKFRISYFDSVSHPDYNHSSMDYDARERTGADIIFDFYPVKTGTFNIQLIKEDKFSGGYSPDVDNPVERTVHSLIQYTRPQSDKYWFKDSSSITSMQNDIEKSVVVDNDSNSFSVDPNTWYTMTVNNVPAGIIQEVQLPEIQGYYYPHGLNQYYMGPDGKLYPYQYDGLNTDTISDSNFISYDSRDILTPNGNSYAYKDSYKYRFMQEDKDGLGIPINSSYVSGYYDENNNYISGYNYDRTTAIETIKYTLIPYKLSIRVIDEETGEYINDCEVTLKDISDTLTSTIDDLSVSNIDDSGRYVSINKPDCSVPATIKLKTSNQSKIWISRIPSAEYSINIKQPYEYAPADIRNNSHISIHRAEKNPDIEYDNNPTNALKYIQETIINDEVSTDNTLNIKCKYLGAFKGCTNLQSVTIANSVKTIGRDAFMNTQLSDVNIASDCTYSERTFPAECTINQS